MGIEIWICNNLIILFFNWAGAIAGDLSLPSCRWRVTPTSSSKKTVMEVSSKKNQNDIILTLKKKLNRTVKRESTDSFSSLIQSVWFRFNHFSGQLTEPDWNHDRSAVELTDPVRFLKPCISSIVLQSNLSIYFIFNEL